MRRAAAIIKGEGRCLVLGGNPKNSRVGAGFPTELHVALNSPGGSDSYQQQAKLLRAIKLTAY